MSSSPRKVLICAPNWLGDSVMAMSALQTFGRRHPDVSITVLTRDTGLALWRMHEAPQALLSYGPGWRETWKTGFRMRSMGLDQAFLLPNSFRVGWMCFLAGIRGRTGLRGHRPPFLLTQVVTTPKSLHQIREYRAVLGVEDPGEEIEAPRLTVPASARAEAKRLLAAAGRGPWAGLIPGAARGPSKRWPEERFAELARRLRNTLGWGILVFGTTNETSLCGRIADAAGPGVLNLAGRTSLELLSALLASCAVVIGNDSGGVHLAAAVGTPVTVVFGLTDPNKTRPPGDRHRVVVPPGVRGDRDIARTSRAAEEALRSISVETVLAAALESAGPGAASRAAP